MRVRLSNGLKMVALAALAGAGGLAASPTAALAHYTTTRCDGDGDRCWLVRCDDDGDDCYRVRGYDRGYGSAYDRPRPRWVCDDDDCHWVYGRGYYARPHFGIRFGWHD